MLLQPTKYFNSFIVGTQDLLNLPTIFFLGTAIYLYANKLSFRLSKNMKKDKEGKVKKNTSI